MVGGRLGDTRADRLLEGVGVRIVLGVQTLLFDKLPEAFKQMEMRGVGRQEQQLEPQALGQILHQLAALIPGIIQDDCEGDVRMGARQQLQQLTDRRK